MHFTRKTPGLRAEAQTKSTRQGGLFMLTYLRKFVALNSFLVVECSVDSFMLFSTIPVLAINRHLGCQLGWRSKKQSSFLSLWKTLVRRINSPDLKQRWQNESCPGIWCAPMPPSPGSPGKGVENKKQNRQETGWRFFLFIAVGFWENEPGVF